jgi:hypothetical protein
MSARSPPKGRPSSPCEQAAAQTYGGGERTWGKSEPASPSRSTGLSVGRTTTLQHPWGTAASGSWPGTPVATPNTGCWHRHGLQSRGPDRRVLRETRETTGALVFGRRTFDLTHGWGGKHPLDVPVFVVSSSVPQEWVYKGSPFTFVTDGLESALGQAQAVAGDKDVGVAPRALCSSASERDSSTRSTATWCPSCWGAASHCSTTSALGRSTWSARG